jgi:hypothetical protein
MNKFKMFAMTALAAAVVGVGSLVASPTASAMPRDCEALSFKADMYSNLGDVALGLNNTSGASYYFAKAAAYYEMAEACWHS